MNFLLQFLCGGVTVVGMTSVARFLHPKYAGIVYALPLVLIVAATFIFLAQGQRAVRDAVWSTVGYGPTLVVFAAALYIALGTWNYWSSLCIALSAWLCSALLTRSLLHLS
jgi:uncharacterized membrane protein (GlpM family)